MNKRLKELYTQVCMEQKLPFTVEHNSAVMLDAFADKFAQLIVAECIDTVSDCSVEYCTRPQIVSEIREHFGVEE